VTASIAGVDAGEATTLSTRNASDRVRLAEELIVRGVIDPRLTCESRPLLADIGLQLVVEAVEFEIETLWRKVGR
jgi:hypothetical protein